MFRLESSNRFSGFKSLCTIFWKWQLHARHDLVEEISCLVGRKASLRNNVVEKLAPRDIFIDEENVCWRVDDFVKANDVRVRTEMQNVDFALDLLLHSKLFNFGLVKNFHGNLVSGNAMRCKLYLFLE